jgi:hypothetical protein
MLNELFLMYSKDMVLKQSSDNQTIHDRLHSVIILAISKEYMLMDQLFGKTRAFKMTQKGLSINLEKILSTEVFSERLSRMAESFLETSRVSSDPGNKTESQDGDQKYEEISSPGRTQKIDLDSQIDDDAILENVQSNEANIADESIQSLTDDTVTKVEKGISPVSQDAQTGSVTDQTRPPPKVCKRNDSTGSINNQLDDEIPRDNEEYQSKDARLKSDREKRGERSFCDHYNPS